jgi:hypothetical protein
VTQQRSDILLGCVLSAVVGIISRQKTPPAPKILYELNPRTNKQKIWELLFSDLLSILLTLQLLSTPSTIIAKEAFRKDC